MSRKATTTGVVCLLTLSLWLNGCSVLQKQDLPHPYSFDERPIAWDGADATSGYTELFAKDLCVVMDEHAFAGGEVSSEAAALFSTGDQTVMYSKNAFERLYPASITKIMTALVAIRYGNLEDKVTVTKDAVINESGATLCHIKPGDVLTLEQLLYGLMLPSGNDAGAAIAVHMAGSVEAFSDMMNQEAKRLAATGTHFMNPHGLTDEEHYTTAYDLYLIFNEALKYPKFREITSTLTYVANYTDGNGNPVSQTWDGGNWYMSGHRETPKGLTVFSGKTGTTQAAGYCLIMASKDQEEKEYISVILKAGSRPGLYDNMTNIIHKIVD
ncbi:MAG: D-alanyl-D-alanine carboxypeptidase [Hungatella sp.]